MKEQPGRTAPSPEPATDDDFGGLRLPGSGLTRQAIRHLAHHPAPHEATPEPPEHVEIPTLKGRVADLLRQGQRRGGAPEWSFGPGAPDVTLEHDDERAAVALACILLEQVRRAGGAQVPRRALAEPTQRLLAGFSQEEVMALEVEAYEVLEWMGRAINPALAAEAEQDEPDEDAEPARGVMSMLRQAIAARRDVIIQYFTGGRAELTSRRVTPLKVEAEKYLHAYCHRRQDDRVFRVNRIRQVSWLHGPPLLDDPPPVMPPLPPRPQPPPPEEDPRNKVRRVARAQQMSLLGGEDDPG